MLLYFPASLQVDIVPSQGEISVGESKFFLCQGEWWLMASVVSVCWEAQCTDSGIETPVPGLAARPPALSVLYTPMVYKTEQQRQHVPFTGNNKCVFP